MHGIFTYIYPLNYPYTLSIWDYVDYKKKITHPPLH